MNVSSANIALTILKNDQASLSTPAKAVDKVVAASKVATVPSMDRYVPNDAAPSGETSMSDARMAKFVEMSNGLSDGSISLFDPEAVEVTGSEKVFNQFNKDPRLVFEGSFSGGIIDGIPKGTKAEQSDANFPSRRDAMVIAYHYANKVIDTAMLTATAAKFKPSLLSGSWESLRTAPTGDSFAGFNASKMETNAAVLSSMFSFDNTTVTAAVYAGKFNGFSLTHGTLGKIMDVSAEGEITLYGSDGTAYSAAEYNAANVDGGIPQLHNDMIRKADADERHAKPQALIDASKQASTSRSATA